MKFGELKVGDIVYLAEIDKSTLVNDEIKKLVVKEIIAYRYNGTLEVHFTNDTLIIVNKEDTYLYKGGVIGMPYDLFSVKLFTCTYESCLEAIEKIITGRLENVLKTKELVDRAVLRLSVMKATITELSVFLGIEKKKDVVTEPVYAD